MTIPHKQAALALADEATDSARAIGAANTLTFRDDGVDPRRQHRRARADRCAAVRAGRQDGAGARRGRQRPSRRVGAARGGGSGGSDLEPHRERALALARELGGTVLARAERADLLVNCTPVGMDGGGAEFKQLALEADDISMYTCVVDFVYSHADTLLVAAAKARGVPVVDGLDLLVAQGALSFERFTGLPAPVDAMRRGSPRGQMSDLEAR